MLQFDTLSLESRERKEKRKRESGRKVESKGKILNNEIIESLISEWKKIF